MAETAKLAVQIFDGRRAPMGDVSDVLVRIIDGHQKQQFAGGVTSARTVFDVPFSDDADDNYAILASKPGHAGAGFHPVRVSQDYAETVDLMLLPVKHRFNFADATWDQLAAIHPAFCEILGAITPDASDRWSRLLSGQGAPLAADVLNILTAMRDIRLPIGKTPLDFLRAINWDGAWALQPDRFYVWVDPALVNEVKRGASQGQFAQEFNPKFFHAGATLSYKETQLAEANVQLTFHENDRCPSAGFEACLLLEPDIDYYPDPLSHGIFEVIPGFFELTDPRMVYVMRWMASRRVAGLPEFDPPYTIEAV